MATKYWPIAVITSYLSLTSAMPVRIRITASWCLKGAYDVILNTDAPAFGGHGLNDDSLRHLTNFDPLLARDGKGWLKLYLPARSAMVLRRAQEDKKTENK